ncbi:MAG: hypothetical protein SF069_11085 [Phycisphaerae bacterium]|nr:hypothetical protein [Phycisphaerae bacterium]
MLENSDATTTVPERAGDGLAGLHPGPAGCAERGFARGRAMDAGAGAHFLSAILPPYLRKTRAIEELIPWLAYR